MFWALLFFSLACFYAEPQATRKVHAISWGGQSSEDRHGGLYFRFQMVDVTEVIPHGVGYCSGCSVDPFHYTITALGSHAQRPLQLEHVHQRLCPMCHPLRCSWGGFPINAEGHFLYHSSLDFKKIQNYPLDN